MISITVPSIVTLILCFQLIIIRHYFNTYKKLTICTDIYGIKPNLQNFVWANNNWMVGSSLDAPGMHGQKIDKWNIQYVEFVHKQPNHLTFIHES